jgi:hypothetical protein
MKRHRTVLGDDTQMIEQARGIPRGLGVRRTINGGTVSNRAAGAR